MSARHIANRSLGIASLVVALTLACGKGSGGDGGTGGSGGDEPLGGNRPECRLLTVGEVAAEIGKHLGPEPDLAYGGCLWRSGDFDPVTAFAPHVIVSIRTQEEFEMLADLDDGVPLDGFAPGAVWGALHRQLWWPCGSKMCLVRAALDKVAPSLDSSMRLGELVKGRL